MRRKAVEGGGGDSIFEWMQEIRDQIFLAYQRLVQYLAGGRILDRTKWTDFLAFSEQKLIFVPECDFCLLLFL